MKIILLFFVIAACSFGQSQTTISGTLLDSSGQPGSCSLNISKRSENQRSPTRIVYQVVGGSTIGPASGYGPSSSIILRAAALALAPGTYTVSINCAGEFGSQTKIWNVPPGGSFDINALMGGSGRTWSQMLTSYSATTGSWSQQ